MSGLLTLGRQGGQQTWQLRAPENAPGVTMQPQDFKIWVGAELLGCARGDQKKILNAVSYVVDGCTEEDGLMVRLSLAKDPLDAIWGRIDAGAK